VLDLILKWISAGDQAITGMGPIVATALAMLAAASVTQLLKFPLAQLLGERWLAWTIRLLAVVLTWLALHYLTRLPFALELVLAVAQPYAYTVVMRVIRHRWPWLEAGKVLGSAQPSEIAQHLMRVRRG